MGCSASCCSADIEPSSIDFYGWKLCVDPKVAREKYIKEGILDEHSHSLPKLELCALLDSPIAIRYMVKYSDNKQTSLLLSLWQECHDWSKRTSHGYVGVLAILKKYKNVPLIIANSDGLFGNDIMGYPLQPLYEKLAHINNASDKIVKEYLLQIQKCCFDQLFVHVYMPFTMTKAYISLCNLICDPNCWVNSSSFTYGDVIARGSFGVVVECVKKSTGVAFAMKIQPKKVMLKYFRRDKERVMTEMQAYAECDHPNVTSLCYAFQTSRLTMLVMPISLCGDLARALRHTEFGLFPMERVLFYSAEIVSALVYLHSFGFIYRDLKLANILLNADGSIMLADFGSLKG